MTTKMNFSFTVRVMLAITFYVISNLYVGWHIQFFLSEYISQTVIWTVYWFFAVSIILGMIPLPTFLDTTQRILKIVGYYFLGVFAVLSFSFIAVDFIYLICSVFNIDTGMLDEYAGAIILFTVIGALLVSSRNASNPVVQKYKITINKKVHGIEKLKVVAASDLHLGNLIGNKRLKKFVKEVNKLNPDVVVLVGDVLDGSFEPFKRNNMGEHFKNIKTKYGAYAVLGNHEYYGKHVEEYAEVMASVGVPVLQDEIVKLPIGEGIYIAGRKDLAARSMTPEGRLTIEEFIKPIENDKPIILLDHQPGDLDNASKFGADLIICGHTHRGQIAPFRYFTKRIFEIDWGHMIKDQLHVIVTSGFGTWGPPIRIGSQSEIVEIEISFKSEK